MKNFNPRKFIGSSQEEITALKMLNDNISNINKRIEEGVKMEFSASDPNFQIEMKMNGNFDILHLDYPENCPPMALARLHNELVGKIRKTCLKQLDELAKELEKEELYQSKKVGTTENRSI